MTAPSYLPTITTELCLSGGAFDFEASDTFTRTDASDTLTSADTGQPWVNDLGTAGISSNRAYFSTLSGGVGMAHLRCLAGGDISVTAATCTNGAGIVFGVQDTSNFYRFRAVPGFATWNLHKIVGGVATLLTNTGASNTSDGVVAKVRHEGSTIKLYIDGVLKATVTDATFPNVPYAGITALDTTARFDNFAAAFVWTDITPYVQGIPIVQRGRQHELAQMETGTADVVLNNQDRRFDPSYTSSPYYPFIVPLRRLRLTSTWSSVAYPLFVGHIERWPVDYNRMATDGTVKVTAVDRTAVIGTGLWDDYPATVLGMAPDAYWRMGTT